MSVKRYLYIILFSTLIFVAGCYTTNQLAQNQNASYIYNPGASIFHPKIRIFHNTDTTTILFVKIDKSEIKLLSIDGKSYKGKLKLHYILYTNFDRSVVVDSTSIVYNIETNNINDDFDANITIKTKLKQNYSANFIIRDLQAQSFYKTFLYINKSSSFTAQNYIVISKKDNLPMYSDFINSKDTFRIVNNRIKQNKVYIKYFKNKYPMPSPPYSISNAKVFTFKPDSSWTVNITDTTYFTFAKKGIYHFQSDSANKEGLTLFYFYDNFPMVGSPENLLKPIQYLTTSKEFNEYNMYASKKEAVDDFWLRNSGNTDRAKELIRVYYNRVMSANKYFSSYTEGWKTDRGMIYIIFGLPTTIYVSDKKERWIYGKNEATGDMVFDFYKADNYLSENDYLLNRFENYKNMWYIAIETWRNGMVYSIAN